MSRHRSIRLLIATLAVACLAPLSAEIAVAGSAPARVKLLSAGEGPREPLRLTPTAGDVVTGSMRFSFGLEQSGAVSTQIDQTMQMDYSTTVLDVATDGTFRITFRYVDFSLLDSSAPRAQREVTEEALSSFAGLSGEYAMTPLGAVTDAEFDIPADVDPVVAQLVNQLSEQLDSLAVPFPTEAVGVGARWRIATNLDLGGINARQVYTYELTARTGDVVELKISHTQTGKRGPVELPGVPSSVDVSLTHFRARGVGSATVDLTGVLPTANTVETNGRQEFLVEEGRDSAKLVQKIYIEAAVLPPE